ncbi:MAG TPA: lipopolysaccharide heptosyltransferase II [Xanthobacteraceae bacterium]|nr:lipopolysaccharide heptosyltransferase II [Xanthobacteraceae bacterium]
MKADEAHLMAADGGKDRPLLIVPYQWIGDFVRCHSVVKLLKSLDPDRPIDILASTNAAPLANYMPGLRKAIVFDIPRRQLALQKNLQLAQRMRVEKYAQVLVMPGTFKAALAPALARIPKRTGLIGEWRFGVLNDIRYDRKRLPRMIDQCASLALPRGAPLPAAWPLPELVVPKAEITTWRNDNGLADSGRSIALAPGAVGPSKRWHDYEGLAKSLISEGHSVWIVGGPGEKAQAEQIVSAVPGVRDLTGPDLRNAILALAAADVAVSNDSGLLHVAAALSTSSIGIFGPTDPWLWAPLNPLAAVAQLPTPLYCQPCHKPTCRVSHHRCMLDIPADRILALVDAALASPTARAAQITRPSLV